MDSSSTSSPFSSRSTSSPENASGNINGNNSIHLPNSHLPFPHSSSQLMQGMQAILSNLTGSSSSYGSFTNFGLRPANETRPDAQNSQQQDQQATQPPPSSQQQQQQEPQQQNAAAAPRPSARGGHGGGSRAEAPKRLYTVDGLQVATPSLDELAAGYATRRNKLLLQGDPQTIHKQRVETAIRVVIDVLRQIPASPSAPAPHPSLATIIPHDPTGNILYNFQRIANFKGLRLQLGTATKASSKKQIAQGTIPPHELAYVETAVYMSGENGKRVYACKRCRAREERRRANKDAARKKQIQTEEPPPKSPKPSIHPPSEDYITGQNSAQYDPHRIGQVVEEPPWDPDVADWRHEIVLFNSPPEVALRDGSTLSLPFRVICYCKCHGEKVGFRIKFVLRLYDGRIIAEETTHPIKITDDHKTDAKSKPRPLYASGTSQPARARKGRMSTASSQRQSPAPSESDMSVTSEVGAMTQKQTPQVRQGKPYSRPPSQSPAVQTSSLPFDFMGQNQNQNDHQRITRQGSESSYASHASQQPDISNWTPDALQQSTVSPDALRHPNFPQMSAMTGMNAAMSNASSVAPSPSAGGLGGLPGVGPNGLAHNDMYGNDLGAQHSGLDLSALTAAQNPLFANQQQQQRQQPRHQHQPSQDDVDMANVANELQNMLFGGSSHASVGSASSYQDDRSSVFSGFNTQSSMFSDNSGLPPESSLDDMIDYSGGESNSAISPMQQLNLSPTVGMGNLDLSGSSGPSPFSPANQLPQVNQNDAEAQTRALLALLARQQSPVPCVSHVIPAEGDMAGGIPVAIAGRLFTPETVIVFGGRPAITTYVTDSFLQCTLPAAPAPGDVPVTVQGAMLDPTVPTMMFKYTGTDKEMMRLMLEVRQRHGAADPAVRLVDRMHTTKNSDVSDRSSISPAGGKPSPYDAAESVAEPDEEVDGDVTPMAGPEDLQSTLIMFLEALDETSPGSLRRSGVVNHVNKAKQTMLHLATVMGFHRLLRRLIVVGARLDMQDANGFTALSFAALCGQAQCARVLLEAGAAYDLPTVFGEMPLDLTKVRDDNEVESLLLSAVWSTNLDTPLAEPDYEPFPESDSDLSEIDNDNPSSESEGERRADADSISVASRALRSRRSSRRSKGKQRSLDVRRTPPTRSRRASPGSSPKRLAADMPRDDPPPYAPPAPGSWMSRTLNGTIPGIPSLFNSNEKAPPAGWVAFPAPSWDTLQKLTSPEEVKLFTQAMAAAAFNAVVQSGATTSHMEQPPARSPAKPKQRRQRRSSQDSGSSGQLSASQVVEQVKQDRMLYLFWLPVLLFVGFWILVSALPIATGFCLLYARQIGRAIKQRL